jgi:hypothetical protein
MSGFGGEETLHVLVGEHRDVSLLETSQVHTPKPNSMESLERSRLSKFNRRAQTDRDRHRHRQRHSRQTGTDSGVVDRDSHESAVGDRQQTGRQRGQRDRQTNRTNRQRERQIDRQADGQTDGHQSLNRWPGTTGTTGTGLYIGGRAPLAPLALVSI